VSATPIQNGLWDWRILCSWLGVNEELIPSGGRKGKGKGKDKGREEEDDPSIDFALADAIMLRRTMKELRHEIAALPPPPVFVDHSLHIPAEGEPGYGMEGKLFTILCNRLEKVIENGGTAMNKLELWMRIRQFMVHPQIYIDAIRKKSRGASLLANWKPGDTTTKWTACMDILKASVDKNVPTIVFCNFSQEVAMVREYASTVLHANTFTISGSSPAAGPESVSESVLAAKAAAESGKPVVLVVQIVAGGVGLNLQFCRRILFLSQHWNPAIVHQACGRAVRIGQTHAVEIHYFRVVDPVLDNLDLHMSSLHSQKISTAKEVCDTLYEGFHEWMPEKDEDEEGDIEDKDE
jgi:hypothetical protein